MAEKIRVNTNTLQNDTTSISGDLKQVQRKIEAMQTDVTAMNQMWTGEANKAFNQAFNDDIKILQSLCEALEELIGYETTAKSEYDKCEKNVASLISSMNV